MKKTDETSENETMQKLQEAASGLLFPSETDAELETFFWPCDGVDITPADALRSAGILKSTAFKSVSVDSFFRNVTKAESWHNDQEKTDCVRFRLVVKTLKDTLKNIEVFRVGETRIEVYIIGKVNGGFAGLKTFVVET